MKFDTYQMVTDKICEMLEHGFIPWTKPWAMAATCAWSGHDGHAYTLLNQFLLADPKIKSFDDMMKDVSGEWVTFKQALDRGGCVRKGESGRKIVFFRWIEEEDDDGQKTGKAFPLMKWSTVFKVSQCDGIEQKFHKDADTLYEFDHDKTADDVADDYICREGIKFRNVRGNKAYYAPAFDEVVVPLPEQFKNQAEYYSTLFHELVHSTGHKNRLDRNLGNSFGKEEYSAEELVAEIGSASILATLGMSDEDAFKNNAAYIQNWLKALKNDKKMIVTASAKAEKAIKMILNIKEAQA